MTILLLLILAYAAIALYVLRAVWRALIDERRDEREIGRYGSRLRPRSRGGRR